MLFYEIEYGTIAPIVLVFCVADDAPWVQII